MGKDFSKASTRTCIPRRFADIGKNKKHCSQQAMHLDQFGITGFGTIPLSAVPLATSLSHEY
eukprot:3509402-Amphidinium_carterae.1